jgi:hypothetical protein
MIVKISGIVLLSAGLIAMLFGCAVSVEDLDQNAKLNTALRESKCIQRLNPVKRGDKLFVLGGAGSAVCYVNFWDNPDPRSKSRAPYSFDDTKVLLSEFQCLAKQFHFARPIYICESFTGRDRYVIAKYGRYVKDIGVDMKHE